MKVTETYRTILLSSLIILAALQVRGQVKVLILDSVSQEPIPFVSVYDMINPGSGTIGDIDGYITLNDDQRNHLIRLSCVGYYTKSIKSISDIKTILLSAREEELTAVNIVSDDNLAIAIIKKVLRSRDNNSLDRYPYYQCRIYLKTTLEIDKEGRRDSVFIKTKNDSLAIPKLFALNESIVEKQYESLDKSYEKILHTSFSGLEKYKFAITPNDLQSMDAYDEVIRTYGRDFINPVTHLSWLKYRFNLSRIYVDGNDSMYVIDFWPKAKATNTLKGFMVISGQDWAIQKIQFKNEDTELYPFLIQKEYKLTNGKWFPVKMINEVKYPLPIIGYMDIPLVFNITATIDSVRFENHPISLRMGNKTEFTESSTLFDKRYLAHVRPDTLSNIEKQTYLSGGVLKDNPLYAYVFNNFESFLRIQVPISFFNIDLINSFRTNAFDRLRIGLGLVTNRELSEWYEFSGYYNYATNPKLNNYGGGAKFYFDKLRSHDLSYSYYHDLSYITPFNFRNRFYNKYFNTLAHRIDGHSIDYHFNFNPFDFYLSLSANQITPLYEYTMKGHDGFNVFHERMLRFKARYIKGRQYNFFNTYYTIRDIDYPIIELNYTASAKILGIGDYSFQAIDLHFNKYFKQNITGQSLLTIECGKIFGSAPIFRRYAAPASRIGRLTLQVQNSFQTMDVNKFWSDAFIHLFATHLFDRFYNLPFSRPALNISWGAGWGILDSPDIILGVPTSGYSKGYHEAGIGVNNIIRVQIKKIIGLGLNVSIWHRMFSPEPAISMKTAVLKLGIGFSY